MSYPQEDGSDLRGEFRNRHADMVTGDAVKRADPPLWGTPVVGSGVMALDAGNAPEEFRAHPDWRDPVPPITDAATLGDGLRKAREMSGRSLVELSAATRVHTRYLTALEQNDWSVLPSRVFAIGYVRAYAAALGLDEQLAVERFKRETPDPSVPLQAPVGVAFEEVRRYSPRIIAGALAVVVAVVGWNIFQRVQLASAPEPSAIEATPESWTLGAVLGQEGYVRLSEPQPAPPDQTIPALYVTPGLEKELLGVDPADPNAALPATAEAPVQRAFNPRGAIHGAPASASQVTLQAKKAASLVVRVPDGRVLFARQLAAGESWRAPLGVAATIDASEPSAFNVYMNGEYAGGLETNATPLVGLNTRAAGLAREAAAREEAERRAALAAQAEAAPTPVTTAPVTTAAEAVPAITAAQTAQAPSQSG